MVHFMAVSEETLPENRELLSSLFVRISERKDQCPCTDVLKIERYNRVIISIAVRQMSARKPKS